MAVIIETGIGVRNASAYAPASFVTTYLTDRGREAENNWNALPGPVTQDDLVIVGTDYIETRWGLRFKGSRLASFSDIKAKGSVVFAGLPTATETFTLGDVVYTFVAALTGVKNEILIGVDGDATASNTFDAITALAANIGVTYGTGTVANPHTTATLATDTVTLEATADGDSGNFTVLSGTPTNVTLNAYANGDDGGSQPLSFPRRFLFDKSGRAVDGVPFNLKAAMAEYAVRAANATLWQDPTRDPRGGQVQEFREKVGPIEEETVYVPGSHLAITIHPYPAADRLLADYVTAAGGATR